MNRALLQSTNQQQKRCGMQTNVKETTARQARKPSNGVLTLYHPNGKNTGSAMQLELRLNRGEEDRYDCFFLEMALQKTQGAMGTEGRTPATFDWAGKVTVKLDFLDVCEFLTVLEGRVAQAGGQRNGIYHESGNANTIISLKRNAEMGGYFLGVSKKEKQGSQLFKGHMLLSEAEALGLKGVLQTGLFFMAFHRSLRPRPAGEAQAAAASQ
jgi:hypothetical protein